MDALNQLLAIVIGLWVYDVDVFAHLCTSWHWLYLGPVWYLWFFLFKWLVLSAPIWIPVVIITTVLKRK